MEQLLQISSVPIEYELRVNNARVERKSGTADLEIIKNDGGGLSIKSKAIKLSMDTYEARNSITPTTKRSIEQGAEQGKQAVYQASAEFVQEGKMLLRAQVGGGREAIDNILQNRTAQPTGEFGLTFLPSVGPNIQWEPGEIDIEYQMDKLNFDAKISQGMIEFIPGNIEIAITQMPELQIEYTGGPIYVPASAEDFFSGQIVDVKA